MGNHPTKLFGIILLSVTLALMWSIAGSVAAQSGQPQPRGYLTTPAELHNIRQQADQGIEPFASAVADVLAWANLNWNFQLDAQEDCAGSDDPQWIDSDGGIPILWAKALAYHLTGNGNYAAQVVAILERIMSQVHQISVSEQQCRLNFAWGVPELVASADLIESYWANSTCQGPLGTTYGDNRIGAGNCKDLFQNWLAKNAYYVISLSGEASLSNWGAAATNAMAHIADYLHDRTDITLVTRVPRQLNGGAPYHLSPSQAYTHANQITLERMNGYRIEYGSQFSCDAFSSVSQGPQYPMVKSQITERGIVPEEARREEWCNVPIYNGQYQNYPQIHLGNNIQQCELMRRRGDTSCFDNIDMTDRPGYQFVGPDGVSHTTHLYPGRGSIERAINAIIIDSGTEWRHESALAVAFKYYAQSNRFGQVAAWYPEIRTAIKCAQDICFGLLTHGVPHETVTVSLLAPTGTLTASSDSLTYVWSDIQGATEYDLWVGKNGQTVFFDQSVSDAAYCNGTECAVNMTTRSSAAWLNNGTYTVWLRARVGGAVVANWSGPFFFTLNVPAPGPVTLGAVAGDMSTVPTAPTFNWTLAGGAVHALWFHVYVAPLDASGQLGAAAHNGWHRRDATCGSYTGTTCTLGSPVPLPAAGRYGVRIQGWGPGGMGAWSDLKVFSVGQDPPDVPTVTQVDQSLLPALSIAWEDDPNAKWFQVVVLRNGVGTVYNQWHGKPRAGDPMTCNGSACWVTLNESFTSGDHTVWMRAWGEGGFSFGGTHNGWSSYPFTINP